MGHDVLPSTRFGGSTRARPQFDGRDFPRSRLASLLQRRRQALRVQCIRDVRAGPDGYLYLLTDSDDGVIARLEPVAR